MRPVGAIGTHVGASVVRGGARLMRGGASLVRGGARLIRVGASPMLVGAGLIRVGASLMRVGAGLPQIGARLIRVGASLPQIGASLIQVGASPMLVGAGLIRVGAKVIQLGAIALVCWGGLLADSRVVGAVSSADQQASSPGAPATPGVRARRGRTYTYVIEEGATIDGYKPGDRELARWALQAWEKNSGGRLRFVPGTDSAPRIRIKWIRAREGQYGETVRAPSGGRPGAIVYIRPDTDSLGAPIAELARGDPLLRDAIVYLTCLHEIGHAIGLTHTADERDIMYSFQFGGDIRAFFYRYRDALTRRQDITTAPGLSAHDIERVRGSR